MIKSSSILVAALFLAGKVSAQSTAAPYGQCGGIGWTGATLCTSGWACIETNVYYSQCLPGATTTPTHTSGGGTTVPPPTTTPSVTTTATGGSSTLAPGYSFIRMDEDPYFHQYLQSQVLNSVSAAVLGSPSTAAQFQITNGQIVQNANGTPLYATVASPANSTVVKLAVSWATTPATLGSFVWSGDSVLWSSPTVPRPQTNAWLICPDAAGNLDVYINLGSYGYMTPAGCSDATLNAYTGSTATP